jgi:diguanylate cyclase (GGDEF)-like protein/PAS domain S-box-containing protein
MNALVGPLFICASGVAPWSFYSTISLTWWFGDFTGVVVVAPFLLAWLQNPGVHEEFRKYLEGAVLFVILMAATWIGFGASVVPLAGSYPLAFLPIPLLVWAALRFHQRTTSTAVVATAMIATWETIHGRGPFATRTMNESLLVLQGFLAVIAVPKLIIVSIVAERRSTEIALRRSEERYALAMEGAQEGLWDWNMLTQELYLSARWRSMLGYPAVEMVTILDEWLALVHKDDAQNLQRELFDHLQGSASYFENEHRIRHNNGSYRWVLARGRVVLDSSGKPYRIAGSQRDITERKRTEEQLMQQALYDALTVLPNRKLFLDRLSQRIQVARREKEYQFAVLFLDLDRFKQVNDHFGHPVGDQLLVAISSRLKATVRPSDTVARMGGDEFAILLDGIKDVVAATRVASRINHKLQSSFQIERHEVFTSASIGIVLSGRGYEKPEDVMRDADTALYRAKGDGRACYRLFDAGTREHADLRMRMEKELRDAIHAEKVEVYYQPIFSLETGAIFGFEALARWKHYSRGVILPAEFIPVAEEIGMVVKVDLFVLAKTARFLRQLQVEFHSDPPFRLNVNLSNRHLASFDIVDSLQEVLQETKLAPETLNLEIHEGALLDNPALVRSVLLQLKSLHIGIHIDDFGTGFTSLSYFHQLPFTALKIDKSFVHGIESAGDSLEIVRTILALAKNLDKKVIAEGVETPEQLRLLKSMGCDYAQGFLLSEPLAPEVLHRFIAEKGSIHRMEGMDVR